MAMSAMMVANSTCWVRTAVYYCGRRIFNRGRECEGWVGPALGTAENPAALAAPAKARGFDLPLPLAAAINNGLRKQAFDQTAYPPKWSAR